MFGKQLDEIDSVLDEAYVPHKDGQTVSGVRILARRLELLYDSMNDLFLDNDGMWRYERVSDGHVFGTGPTPWEALDDAIAREGEG